MFVKLLRFPATSETASISSSGSASHLDDPESTAGSDGRNESPGGDKIRVELKRRLQLPSILFTL